MSTYYDYREVKVMIAHKLMKMDGWTVYEYHADESDSMTDYYSPAHWGGVAEKNGYVLCVDVYGASKGKEIRKYNYDGFKYDNSVLDKVAKLEQMTVARGASEAEEASAKASIERLKKKAEESNENKNNYIVVGHIPAHMEHPPKMNWHIEKDGVIVAKGNGILKFARVEQYYNYSHYSEDLELFKKGKNAYIEKEAESLLLRDCYYHIKTIEDARKVAQERAERLEEDLKLMNQFEQFVNKIDTTCGGLLGEGDGTYYEKVTVTEYKTELKAIETETGSIKEGQCFILKSNFNYGCYKGLVYRIHATEYEGKTTYHAYKLNGKLTKECTGKASSNNYWFIGSGAHDNLSKWIENGSIAWCELQEVKTPYSVEKVIKKTVKAENNNTKTATEPTETTTEEVNVNNYTYEVSEDTDTRTNEAIYLVKVVEKLNREEYLKVNSYIKSVGGYYSKFKHAFIFKENPVELLNATMAESEKEERKKPEQPKKSSLSYVITEDTHTKTGLKIWIVKTEDKLSKEDFAEIKQKFATIKGYYSSFKNGFIFNYNPEEALKTA